jgi:MFS family permease
VPRFFTANLVAFCAYFATFAVFFFTALYLEEVVSDTGYQIALIFLPMMGFMVLASVLAGRWTTAVGPQWSILIGCLLFGAGLLSTSLTLNSHPAYLPLAASLSLCGIGVGSTVVPATSSGLSAVPAERSGMAASAVNTSREIGAVTGVAVLGALVSSRLVTDLNARLIRIGVPVVDRQLVIRLLETGVYGSLLHSPAAQANAKYVHEVTGAAYGAFYTGLHAALFLSAMVVFAAGVISFMLLGARRKVPQDDAIPLSPPA